MTSVHRRTLEYRPRGINSLPTNASTGAEVPGQTWRGKGQRTQWTTSAHLHDRKAADVIKRETGLPSPAAIP